MNIANPVPKFLSDSLHKAANRPFSVKVMALLLFTLLTGCTPAEPVYPLLGGEKLNFSSLHGKVVLINYWADWCRPCRLEIPELNHFAVLNTESVRVLSVNFDGVNGDKLSAQVDAMGIEFDTLLIDPRFSLGALAPTALPDTIVLDRQGKLFKVLVGPQTIASLSAVVSSVP